jgi:microcystin-dependent protein
MRARRIALLAFATLALAPVARAQEPYVGEIKLVPYNFCPNGWMEADGRLLPISENEALFFLYGTTFGGDAEQVFALPDLRGRVPIGIGTLPGGSTRALGQAGGVEAVTLTQSPLPAHTHPAGATTSLATVVSPGTSLQAAKNRTPVYRSGSGADVALAPEAVGPAGGSQPHENMAPYTTLRFCVSLFGVFPSQP